MIDEEYEIFKVNERILYVQNPMNANKPDNWLRKQLDERLSSARLEIFPLPPKLDVDKFSEWLLRNDILNRIHSTTLDVYETLPYRPDLSFDAMWRAFEALMKLYAADAWNQAGNATDTIEIINRICEEAINPIVNKNAKIENALQEVIALMPESVGRFALARMLCDRDLRLASQFGAVSERAKRILGESLYRKFESRYLENGILDGPNHHHGARKILRMLLDQPLTFFGEMTSGLDNFNRWKYIISVILYTARCERYHGDYFSPFISSLSKPSTYYHWYWLLTMTMTFFWIVMAKYDDYSKSYSIDYDKLATSISDNANALKIFKRLEQI
jgi:hypothetical protein